MSLLRIEGLRVYFNARGRIVKANNGVDLDIRENEILGLIGETGCGKSILGRAIMGLLSENVEVGGRIIYKGENLLDLSEDRMRQIRGRESNDATESFHIIESCVNCWRTDSGGLQVP